MSVFREDVVAILPKLRAYARTLCANNAVLADDIVQETLLRALRAQQQFRPGTNFEAWMFTILRNAFYTMVRKQKSLVAMDDEASGFMPSARASQSDGLELRALQDAFGRLKPEHREVLVLVAVEGLAYEAIAERLGCRLGTVKSRINRARAQLREALIADERIDGDAAPQQTARAPAPSVARHERAGSPGP